MRKFEVTRKLFNFFHDDEMNRLVVLAIRVLVCDESFHDPLSVVFHQICYDASHDPYQYHGAVAPFVLVLVNDSEAVHLFAVCPEAQIHGEVACLGQMNDRVVLASRGKIQALVYEHVLSSNNPHEFDAPLLQFRWFHWEQLLHHELLYNL